MKVGDIITAYHKGYHRLDRIEKRYITEDLLRYDVYKDKKLGDEISPLFHYTTLLDSNGNPKKKTQCCDAAFCRLATESIADEIVELEERIELLKDLKEAYEN